MQFKKLIVTDILDEKEFIFDFQSKKKAYRKKDVEMLKSALFYVFFGEPTLSHGKLEFTFDRNGDNLLVRNFEENVAFLQTADGKLDNEDAVNDYFRTLLGMDKNDWSEFFFVNEDSMYEGSFERTSEYFLSFLSSVSIRKETVDKAIERYKEKINDYKRRDDVLASVGTEFDETEILGAVEDLRAETESLQKEFDDKRSALLLEGKAQEAHAELQAAKKEYEELLTKEKDIDILRERLKKSEKIKSMLVALRKSAAAIEENDGLKVCIEQKTDELKAKIKENATGEKILAGKQAEFSKMSATVLGLYTALSELIYDNATNGKSDDVILDNVEKHFVQLQKELAVLRKKEAELSAELSETEKEITVYAKKYNDMHVAQALDGLFLFNREYVDRSTEKLDGILSTEDGTSQAAVATYHALEKKKEDLSRIYILADNILKETDAIDAKINENNAAVNSQQENLDALENAKETLTRYMEKCRKKIDDADADIFALATRKQYYDEIEKLEYGEHCPVCNMPVIDKRDISEAVALTDNELRKKNEDISSYREVMTEYAGKLDEINLRIGSLRAKINTGKGYIESLEQSKLTKIAFLKKLYTEAGVLDRDQLISLLEKTIADIARVASSVNDIDAIKASSYVAGENVKKITVLVKELAGNDNGEALSQCRNALLSLEKEEGLEQGVISGEGAIEGDVYQKLKELIEHKKDLLAQIAEVRAQIEEKLSRSAVVTDGEKQVGYGQLCIAYAGRQYTSVIDEIRKKEEEKQALVNDIAALTGVLKDKRVVIEELAEEVKTLENRFQGNLEYLETIQADERYDLDLLGTGGIAKLEEDVLSEGDAGELARLIGEFDDARMGLDNRCRSLEIMAATTMSAKEWERQTADLTEEENALNEKKALLEEAIGLLSISKTLTKKRTQLMTEAELYRQNYSFVNHVYEDGAIIIKDTVNYALRILYPSYQVENDRGGLILKRGERILSSVNDDAYSVLIVALADSLRYIVSGILGCPDTMRLVVLKASAVGDGLRGVINEYAASHNLVVVYR